MIQPIFLSCGILILTGLACGGSLPATSVSTPPVQSTQSLTRLDGIPFGAIKMTPLEDAWPPVVHAGLGKPEPLGQPINTAGAEDSPFLTLDGADFYFFFTPDVAVPPEKQLFDGLTGIWRTRQVGGIWSEPERVWLAQPGEMALDGCAFILGDEMWFCSARIGNTREIDLYTAVLNGSLWSDWKNAGPQVNSEYEIGEMHISADGQTMVFASQHTGGYGGFDLWSSVRSADGWNVPVNLGAMLNTAGDENRPYLSPDGKQLWFDGPSSLGMPGPAIYRSMLQADGTWGKPEELVSQFAGEPSLSPDGHTLYFTHHYFSGDLARMIEADIYSVYIP